MSTPNNNTEDSYTMNVKNHITAGYGASIYQETLKLKEAKKNVAKTKNQYIFLQKCVKNKLIPKSFNDKCPIPSKCAIKATDKYRFEILQAAKNDAKHRFFKYMQNAKNIQEI